jgi:hypothetical protein
MPNHTPTESTPERCVQCGLERTAAIHHLSVGGMWHAFTAPPPTEEPKGGTEFVWLIEHANGAYWDGRGNTFHHDPNEAVRFARKEDAERVIGWLLRGEPVVAREHGWFAPTTEGMDSDSQLQLLIDQLGRMYGALFSMRRGVGQSDPVLFRVMAEGPLDEIRQLQSSGSV